MTNKQLIALSLAFVAASIAAVAAYQRSARGNHVELTMELKMPALPVYEDKHLRFNYPPGWQVKSTVRKSRSGGVGDTTWTIFRPQPKRSPEQYDPYSNVGIVANFSRKEQRPLDKIFDIKNWRGTTLLSAPKRVRLKGGECIAYVLEDTNRAGALARVHADCYDARTNYYTVSADLADYMQPGKPTPQVKQNADIYERILTSIEFL